MLDQPGPHVGFDSISNGMGSWKQQPHTSTYTKPLTQEDLLFSEFSLWLPPLKSLPLLVPTPAPRGPSNTRKRRFQSEAVLGALGIPTASAAPHPPFKATPSPPIPQNLSPWSRCLLPAGSVGSGGSHWCPTDELPGAGCHVAPWVAHPHLPSPLQQPDPSGPAPMDTQLPGRRKGGRRGSSVGGLGAAGTSPPWAQGKQLHLGWVCAAGHEPGLEAGGDTEDRQLLPVGPPDPPEAPTAPQGCPGAGPGTSMGTGLSPAHPPLPLLSAAAQPGAGVWFVQTLWLLVPGPTRATGREFPPQPPSKPPQPAQYVLHEFALGSLRAEPHQVVGTHHPPRVLVLAQGTCQAEGTLTGTQGTLTGTQGSSAVPAAPSPNPLLSPPCPSSPCLQKPRSYQGQPTVLAVPSTCGKGQSLLLHSPAGHWGQCSLQPNAAGIAQGWAG